MTSLFSPFFKNESDEKEIVKNKAQTASLFSDTNDKMNIFEDLDALECGEAREFIPYNFMLPSKDWSLCKVYRKNYVSLPSYHKYTPHATCLFF